MRISTRTFIALLLLAGPWAEAATCAAAGPEEKPVAELIEQTRRSVAAIASSDRNGDSSGVGSGFFVSPENLLITNLHVIGEGRPFTITLPDGKTLEPEEIVGVDREADLVVIKVKGEAPAGLSLGDSSMVRTGQQVLTVGNPLGLNNSVSRGVIAEERELEGRSMIQVAMPIEPGNSGSPLVDQQGRVVGVIAIKSASSLGFAVPSNALKRLLENKRPMKIARWLRIGSLDNRMWKVATSGGSWRQRAGRLIASGTGSGFGGRMVCLSTLPETMKTFELSVDVKLEDESGAAGLVFHGGSPGKHYGFYPTNGALRLTRFLGPTLFEWTVLQTVPSDAYQPGEWNNIKVRIEGSRIICSVNGDEVIDLEDAALGTGKAGLCKFRTPTAEFRRFKLGADLPAANLDETERASVRKLASKLEPRSPPQLEIVDKLANFGAPVIRELKARATELEKEAFRIKHLAGRVHQRIIERKLADLLKGGEDNFDLVHAALLVSSVDNPELEADPYLELLQRFAAELKDALDGVTDPKKRLQVLVNYFTLELGFRGSRMEYYNRANSYLNEVIDDREGLPISLSILFIELAGKAGLKVEGIGVPRHFIVRHKPGKEAATLLDVFDDCKTITLEDASRLSGTALTPASLIASSRRGILERMIRNLVNVSTMERDVQSLLRYLDLLLLVREDAAHERWQRAVLRARTGQPAGAARDLDWLIEHHPEGIDMGAVESLRRNLQNQGY